MEGGEGLSREIKLRQKPGWRKSVTEQCAWRDSTWSKRSRARTKLRPTGRWQVGGNQAGRTNGFEFVEELKKLHGKKGELPAWN